MRIWLDQTLEPMQEDLLDPNSGQNYMCLLLDTPQPSWHMDDDIPRDSTTKATAITTSLPEITPFIALQLRVARLEQEMSERTKLDDALLKVLERHTADLIREILCAAWPVSVILNIRKAQPSPQDRQDFLHYGSNLVDKKLVIRSCGRLTARDEKFSNKFNLLIVHIGLQLTISSNKIIRLSLSQEPLSTEIQKMIQDS
ncbi:hypothetical protein Tco_0610921 [Tanacetum coccineum]